MELRLAFALAVDSKGGGRPVTPVSGPISVRAQACSLASWPHAAAAAFHLRTRQTTLSTIVIRASSHVLALRAGLFSLGRRKGGCRRSHLLPLHQHMRGEKAMLTQARAGTGGALMSLTGCSRGVAATHLCLARFVGRSISWETSGGQTRSTVPAEDKRGRQTPADPNCLRKTLRRRSKINF